MSSEAGEMRSIEIANGRLGYHYRAPLLERSLGAVVLLHPWFGCWQFWRRTVDALPEFRTYAVDLYSLGLAEDWQVFGSPAGLARAVTSMMAGLGIERCCLMGNSMGGIAAQALSAAEGPRIDKLVLVGTGACTTGVKSEFRRSLEDWIVGPPDRALTERLVGSLLARRPEDRDEFQMFVTTVQNANKAFMGAVLTNNFTLDLRPVLPKITARTLVVRGELDAARTPAHVADLLAGIPNSRAVEIAGGGHSPQVDSPAVFSNLVRDFLLDSDRPRG